MAILGVTGVTIIELKVAAMTVSVVSPEMLPEMLSNVAVMSDWPAATPVARPLALTVATSGASDDQETDAVISREVPSEYMPVAVNCLVRSLGMLGSAGVTAMDVNVGSGLFVPPPVSQVPHPAVKPARRNAINQIILLNILE
jgi:hypothetical protein